MSMVSTYTGCDAVSTLTFLPRASTLTRIFSHALSCKGSKATLQIGSTTAATPPRAIEPVKAYMTANATLMCMPTWLTVLAAVTMIFPFFFDMLMKQRIIIINQYWKLNYQNLLIANS